MVLLRSSISWKHVPEQLSSIWLQRERYCALLYYKEICEKHLHSNYVQLLWRQCLTTHKMGNTQCTSYSFSFVDVMLPANTLLDIIHSAMGNIKVPGIQHCTSDAGRTMHWNFSVDIFLLQSLVCAFLRRFITRELTSVWPFERTKMEVVLPGGDT